MNQHLVKQMQIIKYFKIWLGQNIKKNSTSKENKKIKMKLNYYNFLIIIIAKFNLIKINFKNNKKYNNLSR